MLPRTVGCDLVGSVEQLRVDAIALDLPTEVIPARAARTCIGFFVVGVDLSDRGGVGTYSRPPIAKRITLRWFRAGERAETLWQRTDEIPLGMNVAPKQFEYWPAKRSAVTRANVSNRSRRAGSPAR